MTSGRPIYIRPFNLVKTMNATNPATGELLPGDFHEATEQELNAACEAAGQAFGEYHRLPGKTRATFLRTIAENIEANELLIERGQLETGLPEGRLRGERARTANQLRLFASLLEEGNWVHATIEHAMPNREPLPKPDIRCMERAIGPVAVFCASNFPLAYSVAGGDTASALAVGCPVVVKAHHAHPGVAEMVGQAVAAAVETCNMPKGVFSLIFGPGRTIGQSLVKHPNIKAVGFTGSRAGGRALMDLAAARDEPIPVYAEMSSINPVVILPGALENRAEQLATGLHGSVTLGVGQFCTNPGLVLLPAGTAADDFAKQLAECMATTAACTMLHHGIREAYTAGITYLINHRSVETLTTTNTPPGTGNCDAGAELFRTTGEAYLSDKSLAAEVFGPATLLVTYENNEQLLQLIASLEGQLTGTIHAEPSESADAANIAAALELKVGRMVFNGFPTGVEVCHSMVHGGPYPSTSDGQSTSVGSLAIHRFTRPIAWQACPEELLPEELKEDNPLGICRQVDGNWKQ